MKLCKVFFTVDDGHQSCDHVMIIKFEGDNLLDAHELFMKFIRSNLKYEEKLKGTVNIIEVPDDINFIYCSYDAT